LNTDAWAYTGWADSVIHGERPVFDGLPTTPKPLAIALAVVAWPIDAERRFGIVVIVALAVIAAALFRIGLREGGPAAAVVSVAAFVTLPHLNQIVVFGFADAVAAALVVLALAVAGRPRIASLVLAGLIRPEAWALCAVAGAAQAKGSPLRRTAAGAVLGLLPIGLWSTCDLLLTGDPLASLDQAREIATDFARGGFRPEAWSGIPESVVEVLANETGALVAVAGMAGLGTHIVIRRKARRLDPLVPAAILAWTIGPGLEMHSAPVPGRYFLTLGALLSLGCGLLARLVAARIAVPAAGLAAAGLSAVAVIVAAAATMGYPPGGRTQQFAAAISTSVPAIEDALRCGRLDVLNPQSHRFPRVYISELAARTGRTVLDFGSTGNGIGAVLRVRGSLGALPPWPRLTTPIGTLAIDAARCRR
jgi:hypothetical protein